MEAVSGFILTDFLRAIFVGKEMDRFRRAHPLEFKGIVDTAVRIKHLAPADTTDPVNTDLFTQSEEKSVWEKYHEVKKSLDSTRLRTISPDSLEKIKYQGDVGFLVPLTDPLSLYFEKVLVMSKVETERRNRGAFLNELNRLYQNFGDFEKIVV